MEKLKIGISIGDINGIGLEVILKTLTHKKMISFCTPIIYGSSKVVSYHKNIVGVDFHFQPVKSADRVNKEKINIINCWQENVNITLGKASEEGGKYARLSLEKATEDLKEGLIDALVTAPISKEAMQLAGFQHVGHTEFLTEELGVEESLMLMVHDKLRVGVVTNHLPLKDVVQTINKELILKKIQLLHDSLKIDFGLERPTIAILGLNPHAGDNGVIGKEEESIIRPAIVESKKKGLIVMGPYPADGFFGSMQYQKFDAILAMYHDQGLVPFKTLSFGQGVNFTAGLPGVRTSPDHGTAYDRAGKNEADPSSFRQALFQSIDIAKNRKAYFKMRENALVKKEQPIETEEEALKVEKADESGDVLG